MELPTYTAQDQVPPLANTHVEVERLRRFLISRLFWDYDIKLPREYDLSNHDWCHYVRLAQMLYRMGSMGDSQDWGQCDAQRMERSANTWSSSLHGRVHGSTIPYDYDFLRSYFQL